MPTKSVIPFQLRLTIPVHADIQEAVGRYKEKGEVLEGKVRRDGLAKVAWSKVPMTMHRWVLDAIEEKLERERGGE